MHENVHYSISCAIKKAEVHYYECFKRNVKPVKAKMERCGPQSDMLQEGLMADVILGERKVSIKIICSLC